MKKVAIVGAGVSGLSCALELERHGIKPVIFEKRAHVGEALNYSTIWPRIINRHFMDPIKYLRKLYGISLTPANPIKKIILSSPTKSALQRGHLGYIFRRGVHSYSLERQLSNYLDSPITFNHFINIEDIVNDFDYIIVAYAVNTMAQQLGVWTETFNSIARIATVVGRFNPTETLFWENVRYSKNTFCYLIPNGPKDASLVQIVNGITSYELDYYWKEFLFTENIDYAISTHTDVEHDCGFVKPLQYKNILFVGNSAGFTDDLIGCGGFNAIESGILAARAIAFNRDYGTLVEPIFKDIEKLHELRKAINTLDNPKVDSFFSLLGSPVIKQLTYNNPFFRMRQTASIADRYVAMVRKKKPWR